MEDFTHFNEEGRAHMVDVSEKPATVRTAKAACKVHMNGNTLALVKSGGMKKGDVLCVAQVAGILAAKKTPELIPMCHAIALTGVDISFSYVPDGIEICASARCTGETGVEMEVLTAASVAALTIYDMCKAVQRDMTVSELRLLEKTGGKSGTFLREV